MVPIDEVKKSAEISRKSIKSRVENRKISEMREKLPKNGQKSADFLLGEATHVRGG